MFVLLKVVGEWRFSLIHCDILLTLDVMMCTASILNLCAISIDRCILPLTFTVFTLFLLFVDASLIYWTLSFSPFLQCISLPKICFYQEKYNNFKNQGQRTQMHISGTGLWKEKQSVLAKTGLVHRQCVRDRQTNPTGNRQQTRSEEAGQNNQGNASNAMHVGCTWRGLCTSVNLKFS